MTEAQPSAADIPPCPHCGQPRELELQLMPNLLNELNVHDVAPGGTGIDYGVASLYVCPTSCVENDYVAEVVFAQESP